MIVRLWSLALLATQLALGFDHSIDWKRCKQLEGGLVDTACFIRESCLEDKSDTGHADFADRQKTLVRRIEEPLKDGDCDVVIQMKLLSKKIFHVMMQVKANTGEKLKKDEGLKLDQGATQFHCKDKVQPEGRAKLKLQNTGAQQFNDTHIFCSFTVELMKDSEFVASMNIALDQLPKIVIEKNDKQETLEYGQASYAMWSTMNLPSCDPLIVSSLPEKKGPDEDTLLKEMNTFDNPPFKCTNDILVEMTDNVQVNAKSVSCVKFKNTWKWQMEVTDKPATDLIGKFSIYCTEKICRKCDTIRPVPLTCNGCHEPVLTPSTADVCPKLECQEPNTTWTIDKEKVFDGEAKCKKNPSNKYVWHVTDKELTSAACLKQIDCGLKFTKGNPLYPTVKDSCKQKAPNDECQLEGLGTKNIKCKKGYQLTLKSKLSDDSGEVADSLKCNESTGKYEASNTSLVVKAIDCLQINSDPSAKVKTGSFMADNGYYLFAGVAAIIVIAGVIMGFVLFSKKKKKKAAPSTNNSTKTKTLTPGDTVDGSDKKSTKSKQDKTFKLEEYATWTNEQFQKIILPNFKKCEPDAKTKWVRNCMGRFYAYCNTKKTPESGTFNQFWLLVKQCIDDKCEDAGVWRELFRIAFTMAYAYSYSTNDKDTTNDKEFTNLNIKPFESYMLKYFDKCDFFKRKDEPRAETEMRVICLEILLHTRQPDICEKLRTLTFNEKMEVPLRMLTAACYTRERDEKPATVQLAYKRVINQGVLDPHIAEGWGSFLQHCLFGLAGYLITVTETYQTFLFDAIYQFPNQKETDGLRNFSPTDWLYAYKGALLHINSAKVALDMFKKMNEGSLLHIEALLKQKHKEDEKEEREKTREQYRRDMKEFTMMLADLLVGEEAFNEFKSGLRFVIIFIGDMAKKGEELSEERVRERAINLGNMILDRDFVKQSNEALKAIGAKESQ